MTPRTWTAGETVSASTLTSEVEDLLDLLENRPSCQLKTTGSISIPDATLTDVIWSAAEWDTAGLWTSGTDITIPPHLEGRWRVHLYTRWQANGTGRVSHYLRDHQGGVFTICIAESLSSRANAIQSIVPVWLPARDRPMTIRVDQTTGGALNLLEARATFVWEGI